MNIYWVKVNRKKEELFHERAMCDSRYTSCEHGISMDEYISDYDEELENFKDRLEDAVEKFIQDFK